MNLWQRFKKTSLANQSAILLGVVLAGAAIVQTLILRESVIQSQAALAASVEIARNDQRPWIAVTSFSLTKLEAGASLEAELGMTNSGKTVALEVLYPGRITVEDSIVDVDTLRKGDTPTAEATLFPGVNVTIPFYRGDTMTQGQVDAVKAEKFHIFIFGDITYKDVFGKDHLTQYCGHYVPKTNKFEGCATHHRAS